MNLIIFLKIEFFIDLILIYLKNLFFTIIKLLYLLYNKSLITFILIERKYKIIF